MPLIPPLDHLNDQDRALVEAWDWEAINRADRAALAKAGEMPRCGVCGGALWCGQEGLHVTCATPGP